METLALLSILGRKAQVAPTRGRYEGRREIEEKEKRYRGREMGRDEYTTAERGVAGELLAAAYPSVGQ